MSRLLAYEIDHTYRYLRQVEILEFGRDDEIVVVERVRGKYKGKRYKMFTANLTNLYFAPDKHPY